MEGRSKISAYGTEKERIDDKQPKIDDKHKKIDDKPVKIDDKSMADPIHPTQEAFQMREASLLKSIKKVRAI